jgi:CRISPR-associated protein Csb3
MTSIGTPDISVSVDVTNPGQFFACCGLLELADRLWPGAEGWFQESVFGVACGGTLKEFLNQLAQSDIRSSLSSAELGQLESLLSKKKAALSETEQEDKVQLQQKGRMERLYLAEPFNIWLDWWRDESAKRTELKTWAGKQLVAKMANHMFSIVRERITAHDLEAHNLFFQSSDDSLPFNFDSDLCRTGNARDAGFSADTLGLKSSYRPFLELLAVIGLQRFRPAPLGQKFTYSTWAEPLPALVAAAWVPGLIAATTRRSYAFGLFSRTQYMKAFLPATLVSWT